MSDRYLKQVIVVRKDLSMPTGKLAAMVAHASMTFILNRLKNGPVYQGYDVGFALWSKDEHQWMTEPEPGIDGQLSMAKIVVAANSELELQQLMHAGIAAGLITEGVIDGGYSHNPVGTFAALAIGPAWPEQLDPITGHLKVYR